MHLLEQDTNESEACDDVLFDSSPTILNRDASLPSIYPPSSLGLDSPCMSQPTSPGNTGMVAYDVIDKSELDVYFCDRDDMCLSDIDHEELVLFPGVNMNGAGDGGSHLDYQERDVSNIGNEQSVTVERIENLYKRHNFII